MKINEPEPGFYQTRLVRNGPWVPVLIAKYSEKFSVLECWVGDHEADPVETWHYCAKHPISEARYRWMMATRRWAEVHAPDSPEANPRKAIDLRKLKPEL